MLDRFVPLGVIETSHIIGSVIGAVLLLLSQGLARRLDAAYYLTSRRRGCGHSRVAAQGRGLRGSPRARRAAARARRARPAFDRRAAFFATRFSAGMDRRRSSPRSSRRSGWACSPSSMSSIRTISGGSSRSRATPPASFAVRWRGDAVVLLFAVARLIGHAPHEVDPPSPEDLEAAGAAISRHNAPRIRISSICGTKRCSSMSRARGS